MISLQRLISVAALAIALAASVPASAQKAFYAQATGATLQFPNTSHLYGASFGFYDTKRTGPVSIGADFRGAMLKRGSSVGSFNDQALDMGLFGVRVASAPGVVPMLHNLMPYAEGLIGLGYWRGGIGVTRQDKNHFLMQIVAGADYQIVQHVQWRVVEFTYGRAGAQPGFLNPETLSTGIVLQLP